jgi:hypothetical protein
VRFRETCLAVVVVVARVRDDLLSTFAAPSSPLRCCQTHVLANVRQTPRPLRPLTGMLLLAAAWPLIRIREDPVKDPRPRHWVHFTTAQPLSGTHHRLPLRLHLAVTRVDLVAALLRSSVLLDPGCTGSFAA